MYDYRKNLKDCIFSYEICCSELKIKEAWEYMAHHNIDEIVIHAPYIINLANTIKPETYEIAEKFLATELERTEAMGSRIMVLHPGSHVGAGVDAGINQIVKGINNVLTKDSKACIALETMAGKGSEVGRNFSELRAILDSVHLQEKMGVCLDTCHIWDGGYDIAGNLEAVLEEFDKTIGLHRLYAVHLNDSMNPLGAHKDRHQKIGQGYIGLEALKAVVRHPVLKQLPFILETPNDDAGYAAEIALLRKAAEESN